VNVKVTYQLPVNKEPTGQGDPVQGISFDQTFAHPVKYAYSAADKTYTYSTDTGLETDKANGNQPLKITNVMLLQVAHHAAGYTEDVRGEQGIDFDLQGTGPVDVSCISPRPGISPRRTALCAWSAPTARTSHYPRV
jgi:Protein of unknown function (DUF3048) C-terminal domain